MTGSGSGSGLGLGSGSGSCKVRRSKQCRNSGDPTTVEFRCEVHSSLEGSFDTETRTPRTSGSTGPPKKIEIKLTFFTTTPSEFSEFSGSRAEPRSDPTPLRRPTSPVLLTLTEKDPDTAVVTFSQRFQWNVSRTSSPVRKTGVVPPRRWTGDGSRVRGPEHP